MVALARTVNVNGKSYVAGTDSSTMPVAVVDHIRNPDNWAGGAVPPLSQAAADPSISLSGLSKAQILTALGLPESGKVVHAVTQSANYTLALTDAGKTVEQTGASAATVTVPPNSAVVFPIGTVVDVLQYGAGQVTIAAGAGVTVRTPASLTTKARYSRASLRKRAADEWILSGDLT